MWRVVDSHEALDRFPGAIGMSAIWQFILIVGGRWLADAGALATLAGYLAYKKQKMGWVPPLVTLGVLAIVTASFQVFTELRSEREKSEARMREAESTSAVLQKRNAELTHALLTRPDREPARREDPAERQPPLTDSASWTPSATAATDPGLRVAIARSSSTRFPFALAATIGVSERQQPFGVLLECDRDIAAADFIMPGHDVYTQALQGSLKGDPKSYYVGFASPAVDPDSALVVTVYARRPFNVLRVRRFYIDPLKAH